MKYELIDTSISPEYPVIENGEINTNYYKVNITLAIKPTDNIAPMFSKDIEVISSNELTGVQVDAQRETLISEYMQEINS